MKKRKSVNELNFKSQKAYNKWLAYNYIHNVKEMGKFPNKSIRIKGKIHKVNHHIDMFD